MTTEKNLTKADRNANREDRTPACESLLNRTHADAVREKQPAKLNQSVIPKLQRIILTVLEKVGMRKIGAQCMSNIVIEKT